MAEDVIRTRRMGKGDILENGKEGHSTLMGAMHVFDCRDLTGVEGLLSAGPIEKVSHRGCHMNGVQTATELESLRHSLPRSTSFGDARW